MNKTNIVLIGMPSSGKSTVGKRLSEELGMAFMDTDSVIREAEKRELKEIVNTDGLQRFLEIQEKAVLGLKIINYIIATGGGVVYSEASMLHLKGNGIIVYLEADFEEIQKRITEGRRFARQQGQSFRDIYDERVPLYRKYADIITNCTGKSIDETGEAIIRSIAEWKQRR